MIQPCREQDRRLVLDYLEERFGIGKESFSGFRLSAGPKGRVFLGPQRIQERPAPVTAGLLVARIGNAVKPSTNLLQLFGRGITRNAVALNKENAIRCLSGEDLVLSPEEQGSATEGYVLMRHLQFPLGCGLLKGSRIKNMLPKAKRMGVERL